MYIILVNRGKKDDICVIHCLQWSHLNDCLLTILLLLFIIILFLLTCSSTACGKTSINRPKHKNSTSVWVSHNSTDRYLCLNFYARTLLEYMYSVQRNFLIHKALALNFTGKCFSKSLLMWKIHVLIRKLKKIQTRYLWNFKRCVILFSFPNVGKSSFMNKVRYMIVYNYETQIRIHTIIFM